jgi:TonB-linked SusC/RagA family outer membrane protein
MKTTRWLFAAVVAAATASAPLAGQEPATVTGRVTNSAGAPESGVTVRINTLGISSATAANGTYRLVIPAGRLRAGQQVAISASRVGLATSTRTVALSPGSAVTQNFQLGTDILELEGIVATGVSGGAMERAKVPFSVARVDASQMPVQAVNPLGQLQGKVPGANIAAVTGRPGAAPQVLLRGPTSINAAGRSQEPLYIMDGVVLAGSIADLNPADIETVEVVKGAAAATLYGSRAASGVISITTKRGREGGVRFNVRSEYGFNDIERDFGIARNHAYLLDETGTRFCAIDAYGSSNVCTRTLDYRAEQARINNAKGDFALNPAGLPVDPGSSIGGQILRRAFSVNRYPGQTFNAVAQLVDPKPLFLNDMSMSGRSGSTSFFVSGGHTQQGGAIAGLDGYERFNGRVNLGHQINNDWSVDVNTYISRSRQDGVNAEEFNGPFFRLTRVPAAVDITQRDTLGRLYIRPNIGSGGTQNENPLYYLENSEREDTRWRYLLGGTIKYAPAEWIESDANFSMDRLNLSYAQFENKEFRTPTFNELTNNGRIFNGVANTQSLNTSAGVTLRPELTSKVATRFTGRWLYEQQDDDFRDFQGRYLRVANVRAGANATDQYTLRSADVSTRQMSFSGGAFIDVLDRYTVDLAVRRDGNSRFGAENRWQTYGRASAAWLMAREGWFPSEVVSAFTVRGSYGTAGNAPRYAAQYETYNIGAGGALLPVTLGNARLRPEVVTEAEVGLDMELLSRFGLSVTYANSLSKNQILPVPVIAASGFATQWQNAGELRNRTLEASLSLPIVQSRGLTWTSRVNYTRNRTIVEKLYVPPFDLGTDQQGTNTLFRIEEGTRYGTFYGREFMTSCSQLPAQFQGQCGGSGSAFQRNSEGFLVWVGQGNNPGMGITHNLWNAVLPGAQAPYGVPTSWGMPIVIRDANNSPERRPLGHSLPDYRLGFANTVQYKNLSVYGLLEGAFGQSVYNQGRHWSYLDFLGGEIDQEDATVETAKPIGYYYRAGDAGGIGGFYDVLAANSRFVEDASYMKLRELSVSYRLGRIMGNRGDWTVSAVGRNLKTWTDYKGFDPEVGLANAEQVANSTVNHAGSGLINAIDAFTFPQLRSVSFVVSTKF